MRKAERYIFRISLFSVLALLVALLVGFEKFTAPIAVFGAITFALGMGTISWLKSYRYTAWIVVAILCGMLYPQAFQKWGNFDLRDKWVILIVVQMVMFGMGTQMSLKDFTGIKSMGKGVLVGIICQFTIMPVTGYILTRIFNFDPEIAAGVILIGSCSSGLASNVMVYIAKANLTLSVTLTSVATLLAPIMTPFWMKMLAGTYVQINFLDMCIQIIKIVVVPVGAALLYDAYLQSNAKTKKILNGIFYLTLSYLIGMLAGLYGLMEANVSTSWMELIVLFNFLSGAVIFGKCYYLLTRVVPKIQNFMPKLSMFGIVYFTTVTTAASRENILAIGVFMLLASILHNGLGYTFGYSISKLVGMDRDSCRTVALEVGLQNGGMASGLAGVMGKLATVGLASAIFSPWMNISGSVLANYWKRKKLATLASGKSEK